MARGFVRASATAVLLSLAVVPSAKILPGQTPGSTTQVYGIPDQVISAFRKHGLEADYEVSFHLNPFYLHGDFNGDRKLDVAVLVKQRSSGKVGIIIIHSQTSRVFVLGAGRDEGIGSDDFKWMDYWYIYPKGPVARGAGEEGPIPRLRGDALLVEKSESASGLIYWNGKRYCWYQQGD